MAEVVNSLPERERFSKYRLDEWFDGKCWRLSVGDDYASAAALRNAAYQAARARGLRVTVGVREGGKVAYVQAFRTPDPAA